MHDDSFDTSPPVRPRPAASRGRGACSQPDNRYSPLSRLREDDGWTPQATGEPATELILDRAKSVIVSNNSPDVPFRLSINPYRGCEHGCAYCFARPSHAYLGLSPGLDFETKIAWKPDAPQRLREELAHPRYRPSPIALGINTDAWQPVERRLRLTRSILEVLRETRHPVSIVTKSALIERDVDLLADMARDNLASVMFSITTLDSELARRMEPRAATPARRLEAMARLYEAGVPVGVLFAPLIPALNDHEMEAVLQASVGHGARTGGYALLRLPLEMRTLFRQWLEHHVPGRAEHVLSLMRQLHGGREYDASFGKRMRGEGPFAAVLSQRFRIAEKRLDLNRERPELSVDKFVPPRPARAQGELF